LKKLSLQLQPYHEVVRIIEEILEEISEKNNQQGARVLQHLISYAKDQFGDRVPGKAYRERGFNGERIDNWRIEAEILIPLYFDLVDVYSNDESLSMMARDNLSFPYYEKILDNLKPWSKYLDLNRTHHIDSSDKKKINDILFYLSQAELFMGPIYRRRNQYDRAENHCQHALSYARLFEGKEEDKTNLVYRALNSYYVIYSVQGNYAEALTFAEDAYV
jgi:tetratricopeptide (TPR) repeat protein